MGIFDTIMQPHILERLKPEAPPPKPFALQIGSMQSAEVDRILKLPICTGLTKEESLEFSRLNILAEAFSEGFRLMDKQAEAVLSYQLYTGPFLPIGVGGGKTGISLMIPDKAYRKGLRKMVLVVPSGLIAQLWNNDIPYWRKRVPMSYPIHLLAGRSRAAAPATCGEAIEVPPMVA